jgi:hypothetical protein
MKTYLTIVDEFPPALCRLVARNRRRGLTDKELSLRVGWSIQKVVHIASQGSWEGITVGDMASFMTACGVSPSTIRHQRRYLKRTMGSEDPLHHLRLPAGATLRLLAALPERAGTL